MKKIIPTYFAVLLVTLSSTLLGVQATDHSTQADLKDQLFMQAREGHRPLSYDEARKVIFGRLYLERSEDNRIFLRDLYCNYIIKSPNVGVNEIPGNKVLNVEHIWPQSKFNPRLSPNYQKSDLHHLLPVDSMANSIRGNNPFGEVTDHRSTAYGTCKASWFDRGHKVFEPSDEIKGNIARAMFYFSIRYKAPIDQEQEIVLRHWNQLDPVTAEDREMHERIAKIQGNRNPFVDDPTLVDSIIDF